MKPVALVALWIIGTAAAIAVASAGVDVVNDEIIDPPPAVRTESFTSGTIPADGATGAPADTNDDFASATTSSPPATTAPDSTTSVPGAMTTAPNSGTTPASDPTPPSTSTSPSSTIPSTTTTAAPPPTTTTAAVASETRTFELIGGTAAISFSPSGVEVLWATANPGFEVKVEPESPGLKVEFRSDQHRSRVDAWWADGPRSEVREDAQN